MSSGSSEEGGNTGTAHSVGELLRQGIRPVGKYGEQDSEAKIDTVLRGIDSYL